MKPNVARFALEYSVDRNGAQAAIRAGYSPKTARVKAAKLLAMANVKAAVAEHELAKQTRTTFTADRAYLELARIATSDVTHYKAGPHSLELAEGAPRDAMRAVKSVKIKRRIVPMPEGESYELQEVEFTLHDKTAAIKMAMTHHGMLTQKIEHSGGVDMRTRAMTAEELQASVKEKLEKLSKHPGA